MNTNKIHSDMLLLLCALSKHYSICDVRLSNCNELEGKIEDQQSSESLAQSIDDILTDLHGSHPSNGAGLSFTQTIQAGDIRTEFCIFHADN